MSSKKSKIADLVHPEYIRNIRQWIKFWMAYQGGKGFIDLYLKRYSKREHKTDFDRRKEISYNPADAKDAVNDVRDALLKHLHGVQRTGDRQYLTMMAQDVDTFRSSMLTFLGTEILPRLLTQEKVYVFVDSPPQPGDKVEESDVEGSKTKPILRAEETKDLPYLWMFTAEQCKSWTYDKDGKLIAALIEIWVDVVDEATGLTTDTKKEYRLVRMNPDGSESVEIIVYDDSGIQLDQILLRLPRLPIVEFRIAQSLMTDIADMQIALLQLASTDMSFLFRGNFPLYTEQFDPVTDIVGARARKKTQGTPQNQNTDNGLDSPSDAGSNVGVAKGRRYKKGLTAPSYVAPPTGNLTASMSKQEEISKKIRASCDLALTSLSTAAMEQSGESKKQDRVGLSAGLRYIATQLENAEREIADVIHLYLGKSGAATTVDYPDEYTMETDEQKQAELARLEKARTQVPSEEYQKEITKQMVRIQLRGVADEETVRTAQDRVDEMQWMDLSKERAEMIRADVIAGVLSAASGAKLRGHDENEPEKRADEEAKDADRRAFGSEAGDTDPEIIIENTEPSSDVAPLLDAEAVAPLNGAQVSALLTIVTAVTERTLPVKAARQVIKSAFPTMADKSVETMIKAAANFTPAKPSKDTAA